MTEFQLDVLGLVLGFLSLLALLGLSFLMTGVFKRRPGLKLLFVIVWITQLTVMVVYTLLGGN